MGGQGAPPRGVGVGVQVLQHCTSVRAALHPNNPKQAHLLHVANLPGATTAACPALPCPALPCPGLPAQALLVRKGFANLSSYTSSRDKRTGQLVRTAGSVGWEDFRKRLAELQPGVYCS